MTDTPIDAEEPRDRITEVHVQSYRCLSDVRLPIGGMTTIVGENGSGKSSLLEAIRLVHTAATIKKLIRPGTKVAFPAIDLQLRTGGTFSVSVLIEGDGPPILYNVVFSLSRGWVTVLSEATKSEEEDSRTIRRTSSALLRIDIHDPIGRGKMLSDRLLKLCQSDKWEKTLELVRLGIDGVKAIRCSDSLTTELRFELGVELFSLSTSDISRGEINYLSLVAATQLSENASLVVFDSPEDGLSDEMIPRVAGLFDALAEKSPVLVSTRSNKFLDCIGDDDIGRTALFSLNHLRHTCLSFANAQRAADWSELSHYTGMGSVRAAGMQHHIFTERQPAQQSDLKGKNQT